MDRAGRLWGAISVARSDVWQGASGRTSKLTIYVHLNIGSPGGPSSWLGCLGSGASAPTRAAEQRLQAEIGRRAVNISKEIFEAAGVPVPPGYVKIGAGDLRRVSKEIAR